MINPAILKDLSISKLLRKYRPGELVFKQGEMGKSMFIIIEGMVHILSTSDNQERLIAIPGAGEILGERAIVYKKAYNRNFTAQAKTTCILLEIDADTLTTVLAKVPDFHTMILGLVLSRLDKANHLIRILQITDPIDRLVEYVLYFNQHHCKKLPDGVEVGITATEIQQAVNLDASLVEECLQDLASHGILNQKSCGYALENRNALLNYVPTLKYVMAA